MHDPEPVQMGWCSGVCRTWCDFLEDNKCASGVVSMRYSVSCAAAVAAAQAKLRPEVRPVHVQARVAVMSVSDSQTKACGSAKVLWHGSVA